MSTSFCFDPKSSSLILPHGYDPVASTVELILMHLQRAQLVHLNRSIFHLDLRGDMRSGFRQCVQRWQPMLLGFRVL
eukprot:1089492-Amphidinium_carterae.1